MRYGKLVEDVKTVVMHPGIGQVTAATATYGGAGVDTQGFRDAKIVLNVGTCLGPTTLGVEICENSANSPVGSIPITGAAFLVSATNDQNVLVGNVQGTKRYLFARAVASAPGSPTITGLGITAELGDAVSAPVSQSQTVAFDVGVQ
jgi:hypothetical protein